MVFTPLHPIPQCLKLHKFWYTRDSLRLAAPMGVAYEPPSGLPQPPTSATLGKLRKHSNRSSSAAGRESSGINQVSLQSSTAIESMH